MARPPARDKETRELIQRLQAGRARRRKLRVLLTCLGGAIIISLVAVVVVLTARGPGDQAGNSSTVTPSSGDVSASVATSTSSTTTEGTTTTEGSTTTTAPVTTTGQATTTSGATTTSSASSTTSTTTAHPGHKVVVIDPGHQAKGDSSLEPIGPGSSEQKAKVSSGSAGVVTGTPESELVLTVSLKLRDALVAHGIEVVMIRTTQDVNISNIERTQMANEAGADLFVRIHADGAEVASVRGIHTLYPASIEGWTDDIAAVSKKAAALCQKELVAATGANDRGIDARSDMTGFNWSDVPVIIPEIGFMTNEFEDRLLATAAYQDKIVKGLTKAILSFLGVS
jgi:N-acetylmuramoyl-L-alanine amidase